MAVVKISPAVGKDIIYVCTFCQNREKEFAYSDRQYKYCSKCGSTSVKSTLTDSFNYVSSTFTDSSLGEDTYE